MKFGEMYSQQNLYNFSKKNEIKFGIYFLIYFLFSYLICLFDIGSLHISVIICKIISSFIHTIEDNAAVSPDINSSKLIISMTWISILPFSVLITRSVPWMHINVSKFRNKTKMTILMLLLFIVSFYCFANIITISDTHGRIRILYALMSMHPVFSSIYGLVIYASVGLPFAILLVLFVIMTKEYSNSSK